MPKRVFIGCAIGDEPPTWIPVKGFKIKKADAKRGRPPGIAPWKMKIALFSLALKVTKSITDDQADRKAATLLRIDRAELRRARLEHQHLIPIVHKHPKTGRVTAFFSERLPPGRHEGRVDYHLTWQPGEPPKLKKGPVHVDFIL